MFIIFYKLFLCFLSSAVEEEEEEEGWMIRRNTGPVHLMDM